MAVGTNAKLQGDNARTAGDEAGTRAVLDIEGMTCAMCVATITEGLDELPGMLDVNANLATAKAIVRYDAGQLDVERMVREVRDRGYGVHTERQRMEVEGMTDATSVQAIERALQAMPGVVSANVNLATNSAVVDYSASSVTPQELVRAVRAVGYGAALSADGARPVEDVSTREVCRWRNFIGPSRDHSADKRESCESNFHGEH